MPDASSTTPIPAQIIALIAKSKSLDPATLTPATTFDELQIDSLDKINLSFEVEELFKIEIPDTALNSLRTVGDVIAGVERLQLEKASQPTA
jgi:acyl carrier protein